MTAFSSYQVQTESACLRWELKSVNHRYLDLSFRLPEEVRAFEPHFRQIMSRSLTRGKVECHLKMTRSGEAIDYQALVHENLASALIQSAQRLSHQHQLTNDLAVSHLFAWPGIVEIARTETASLKHDLEQSFTAAVEALVASKKQEGLALAQQISGRLQKMTMFLAAARQTAEVSMGNTKKKLLKKLDQLNLAVEDQRLDQEVALFLTKLDVSEEFDRLQSHITEAERILCEEQIQGRRLDFLMQEFNREANTLSAKSDDSELTKQALEMKVLIEQMREQIQNIE